MDEPVVLPETGDGFVHPLAWFGFALDLDATWPDAKDTPTALDQREPADHEVRPPRGGIDSPADEFHELVPDCSLDDRDLSGSALVDASIEPPACDHCG